jgi:hypothetical protein
MKRQAIDEDQQANIDQCSVVLYPSLLHDLIHPGQMGCPMH